MTIGDPTSTAPATPTERAVVEMFEELFVVDNLSINTDIFDLGGDSLTAQQVVWRVRDIFDLDLPLSVLFDAPTIRDLSGEIDRLRQRGGMEPFDPD